MTDKDLPQFIHSRFVDDITLADRIIEFYHEHSCWHTEGRVKFVDGTVHSESLEGKNHKKSTEIYVSNQLMMLPLFKELNDQIQISLGEYLSIYPQCDNLARFYLGPYNIQYYKPREGYLAWHCDQPDGTEPFVSRVLVFLFYCHDINDGGGTEFLHQDYVSKSEKGKIIIFPPDWKFTHRGVASKWNEKMIATGWWNFQQN